MSILYLCLPTLFLSPSHFTLQFLDNFCLLTFPPCWLLFLKDPIDSGEVAQLQTHMRAHTHRQTHTQTHMRTHNYDESGWIFVMTGLTEPLVIGGSAGKGEGYKRVIMPPP